MMLGKRLPSRGSSEGRKVFDKSYYAGKLRSKRQELQNEIEAMTMEIDRLKKREPANFHLANQYDLCFAKQKTKEQMHESLKDDVKLLRTQLGDYNVIMEKVAAGIEVEQLKEDLKDIKENNQKEKRKLDHFVSEANRMERETKEFEEHLSELESELEHRLDYQPGNNSKELYFNLKQENQQLVDKMEEINEKVEVLNTSIKPLERVSSTDVKKLMRLSPLKQKTVVLVEQYWNAVAELEQLKSTVTNSEQITRPVSREKVLSQIKQDNVEIAKAEEKSVALEADIKLLQDELVSADRCLAELKGGKADKFMEMHEKDKKMQAFIDEYETIHLERTQRMQSLQKKNELLVEKVMDFPRSTDDDANDKVLNIDEEIAGLTRDLEEGRKELEQLKEMEEKTQKEIAACTSSKRDLEAGNERFTRLDEVRDASETKCSKLEEEKKSIDEKNKALQFQLKEQVLRLEELQREVYGNKEQKTLEALKNQLCSIQQNIIQTQEEIDKREKEVNYKPLLENIRFMVGQLNEEIKNKLLH